jgi:hypothetical protein
MNRNKLLKIAGKALVAGIVGNIVAPEIAEYVLEALVDNEDFVEALSSNNYLKVAGRVAASNLAKTAIDKLESSSSTPSSSKAGQTNQGSGEVESATNILWLPAHVRTGENYR